MTEECEFFDTAEEGNFVCKKIGSSYKDITKEMCRTICPVGIGKKRCEHLKFTLRKDQSFSAIGIGGRKTQILFEKAVCKKLQEQIFDTKKCETCLAFRQVTVKEKEEEDTSSSALAKDELIQKGIKLLIDGLGKENALEFIKKMKSTSSAVIPPQPKKEEEKPLEKKEEKKEEDELSLDKWLPADF